MKAIIAHQTFHVYQFKHLARLIFEKYGQNANIFTMIQREEPLLFAYSEGLAVYAIEKLFPRVPRPGIKEENVP